MTICVSTLPIAPKKDAMLGILLAPFAARIIASESRRAHLAAVNIVGAKGYDRSDAERHLAVVRRVVGGEPVSWIDRDVDWDALLTEALETLRAKGMLIREDRTVWNCPCGLSERLETGNGLRGKRTTVSGASADSAEHCMRCDSELVRSERPCLLLTMPPPSVTPSCAPRHGHADLVSILTTWTGRSLLVDRTRDTGVIANVFGERVSVDADLCLMCMPWVCMEQGRPIETFVAGTKTMRQTALSVIVSDALGCAVPRVHVLPYVSMPALDLSKESPVVCRILLAMAAGAEAKKLCIDDRDLALARSCADAVTSFTGDGATPGIADFKKPRVTGILSRLRKGIAVSDSDAGILAAIR